MSNLINSASKGTTPKVIYPIKENGDDNNRSPVQQSSPNSDKLQRVNAHTLKLKEKCKELFDLVKELKNQQIKIEPEKLKEELENLVSRMDIINSAIEENRLVMETLRKRYLLLDPTLLSRDMEEDSSQSHATTTGSISPTADGERIYHTPSPNKRPPTPFPSFKLHKDNS